MSAIDKSYDPSAVEDRWYAEWLERKAFAAKVSPDLEPHVIVIPPPNVTGILHMGHILNNTLQDILTRRARLEGKEALWLPGTDHAGIATQTRVDKQLREQGTSRRELGREKFLEKVWEWKEKHGGIILNQLKKLGASCDWDRTAFTLDEHYSRGVLQAFVDLYDRGYVYRGLRMSNWCPKDQTALSNEEVTMRPQKGHLYKMRYELVEPATGSDGVTRTHLEISTTRPETLMGDTAVAVNPKDERYSHLVGKMIWRPFPREQIPIIADEAVDLEFGTGALKVTPAHDTVDFEIGQRHNLPIIDVLNPDGTISEAAGEFVGMDRFEARKAAAKKLEELGLLVETEDYENNVGFSERGGVPIEPRLTEQWWMRYPKVREARRAVEAGILRFHPKRWEKTYLHWLETMERDGIDWCVSRQLWWGHRIPVWYRKGEDRSKWTDADYRDPAKIHVSVDGPSDPENWEQDSDVLDTWASSWLWPMANFGWPSTDEKAKAELDYFYPTSTLVTAFDIIFLWVARMVMAGLEFRGEAKESLTDEEIAARVPFRDVCMTGLIRDDKRRKMSKSLGNSPDPLDLIAKYGADGLRFGIVSIAPSGQDILFSEERIEIGRNFCNKLWNACRFRLMSGPAMAGIDATLEKIIERVDPAQLDAYDHWILGRLVATTKQIEDAFGRFEMPQYAEALYGFFWSDYCDWYVEASKAKLRDEATRDSVLAVIDLVLRQSLLLLEPLVPFITEELWHGLGFGGPDELIQDTQLPTASGLAAALKAGGVSLDAEALNAIESVKELITKARALKAEYNVANKRDVTLCFVGENAAASALVSKERTTILSLIPAGELNIVDDAPEAMPAAVTKLGTVYLDVASSIDIGAERDRLSKELAKLEKGIQAGEAKLSNDKFVNNAPAAVVEGAKAQLAETKAKHAEITRLLESLG
jgi:valyl-tRNA synthetase